MGRPYDLGVFQPWVTQGHPQKSKDERACRRTAPRPLERTAAFRAQTPRWRANAGWQDSVGDRLSDAQLGGFVVRQGRFSFCEHALEIRKVCRLALRGEGPTGIFGACHGAAFRAPSRWQESGPVFGSTRNGSARGL